MPKTFKNRGKVIFLLIFLFLLASPSLALVECEKQIFPIDSPCLILLSHNSSASDCNSINVSFYNNASSNFLSNKEMSNFTHFLCNATFDFTSLGTYTFLYSTGDSGSITIKEDVNNSYYLYILALIIWIFLIWLGYYLEDITPIVISGFLVGIIGINIFVNGFPNLTNDFLKNAIAIVLMGVAMYFIVAPIVEEMQKWQ